ncbi:hypothetical protein CMEL01_04519 [Colletotrichum melonis]|uniref:Uncharacterized protein n=1 Tax=Colletotrichum melonis TaxID=1209925 RepID=A0AAI9UGW2_9PEZI|nr:hypothetical protein CMEL01_04519 [Colletotrichum melonis]
MLLLLAIPAVIPWVIIGGPITNYFVDRKGLRIFPSPGVADPRAVYDIYGHGANSLKDAWYDGGAGEFRHMSDERIKTKH